MLVIALLLLTATGTLSFLAVRWLSRHGERVGLTDFPNDRSLHVLVTPRAGGAGFAGFVPFAAAAGLWLTTGTVTETQVALLGASLGLAVVGFADDRWTLSASVRFIAQFIAAILVVVSGVVLPAIALPGVTLTLGRLAAPLTVAWLVFVTNIYNFMDGIDGLAGVQALVTTAAIAVLSVALGRYDLALVMAILGSGVVGFLAFNWPPARIFMGDVGSTFLGFTFAAWSVLGTIDSRPVPFFAWMVVLSPFLADATITIVRRALRGEPLWKAHRTHFYQRLVQSGWTHKRTTLLYGALALWTGGLTILHYALGTPPAGAYVVGALLPLTVPALLLARQPQQQTAR